MVQVGNRIIAVGKFTSVTAAPPAAPPTPATASSRSTPPPGAIDTTFVPNVGTKEVSEVVDAGDGTVFIGGLFATVNGAPRPTRSRGSTRPPARSSPRSRRRRSTAAISDMQLVDNRLYIGGSLHHGRRAAAHPAGRAEPDDRRRHRDRRPSPSPTRGTAARSASSTSTSATTGDPGRGRQLPQRQRPEPPADRDGRPERSLGRRSAAGPPSATRPSAPACSTPTCATSTSPRPARTSSSRRPAPTPAASTPAPCATRSPAGSSARPRAGQNPTWVDYSGGDTVHPDQGHRRGDLRRRPLPLAEQPVRRLTPSARAPSRAPGWPRSTRATACRSAGTPPGPAASASGSS